jgi:hypothetical protein
MSVWMRPVMSILRLSVSPNPEILSIALFLSIAFAAGDSVSPFCRLRPCKLGGRQLRRFCLSSIIQQRFDVRSVRIGVRRTRNQSAVQRYVHLGKQTVEEIIDGSDRVRRIQVVGVKSRDLCAHA